MIRHRRLLVSVLLAMLVITVGVISMAAWALWRADEGPRDTFTTYYRDPVEDRWLATVEQRGVTPNADGSTPQGSHTVTIELSKDDPVKVIWIEEALVIGGGTEPLVEIDGDPSNSPGSRKIVICNLILEKVEAAKLEVDADVVRVTAENIVAEDSSDLDLDLEVVNVIACGRGASSTLFLGVGREDLVDRVENALLNLSELLLGLPADRETGIRIDRLRILGPSSGNGFIENLIIRRTSVFGEIRVDDVEIQNVLLRDVSIDDDLDDS